MTERKAAYRTQKVPQDARGVATGPSKAPGRIPAPPRNRCVMVGCGGIRPSDLATCLPCLLAYQLAAGDTLPVPVKELRFHPVRKWRFDLSWPDRMIACEVDGATMRGSAGRHTSGVGYQNDCTKINTATSLGWAVYRFTRQDVERGTAAELVRRALARGQGLAGE